MAHDDSFSLRLDALHLTALWSLAVAQPVFDLLGENPEFFVAHDARPADLLAFTVLLCLLGPGCLLLLVRLARRLGPRVAAGVRWTVVAALFGLIALPGIDRSTTWSGEAGLGAAVVTGGLLALVYLWWSPLRLFTTLLSPAIVVVPLVFALQPSLTLLWRTTDVDPIDAEFATTPPVVVVVFDQLPLTSLLDADGGLDADLYPHFASLARDAWWFPNATTVAGLTELAVPALLTGARPEVGRLPVVEDHPGNLFTLLGARYRLNAVEPITRLCPDRLCNHDRPTMLGWFGSVLPDVVVVYLHIVLPEELTARLPPVTQNWKNFVANDTVQGRWVAERDADRRRTLDEFVASIGPMAEDDPPPLHFLHVLFPHEPWVYLPTGQLYAASSRLAGLSRRGRWVDDPMAVLRAYQRHLLQVRFADRQLGRILDRLRGLDLYDSALIVVASDHGASFQPELLFRSPRRASFAEVTAVPLLVKEPGQRRSHVVTRNVETVDVVPTMAAILGVDLPWVTDGVDVRDVDAPPRPDKRMTYADGRGDITGPADLHAEIAEVVAQKYARFGSPDGFTQPRLGLFDEVIGRSIDQFELGSGSHLTAVVDFPGVFADVNPDADFVPAHVTGAVLGLEDDEPRPVLAVALNDVLVGITRPYPFPVAGRRNAWEVVVDPGHLMPGANAVDVYAVVETDDAGLRLEPAYASTPTAPSANLILEQARAVLGVETSGFFLTEWRGQQPFRWTRDTARLRVPVDLDDPPTQLVVDVIMTGPMRKTVAVMVNDCLVFDGEIHGAWRRTFPLLGCQLGREILNVELRSEVSPATSTDRRRLGVAVGSIELR